MRKRLKKKKVKVDLALARKVLSIVDKGLVSGIGVPEPGKMCVEAAVAFASGEDHNDNPQCVADYLANEKISLNDRTGWKNNKARAKGLRRVAIAQLGSRGHFDPVKFRKLLYVQIQPIVLAGIQQQVVESLADIQAEVRSVKSIEELADMADSHNQPIIDMSDWEHLAGATEFDGDDCVEALENFTNMGGQEILETVAEAVVQVLIKMKIKGTKYLHLTERKKRKAKKK